MPEYVAAEIPQVVPAHDQIVDNGQRLSGLIVGDAVDDPSEDLSTSDAEGLLDILRFDLLAGKANHLVESGLRVAHRPVAGASDFANRLLGNRNLFRFRNFFQPVGNLRGRNGAKFKELTARSNRLGDLVLVSGRHNKDDAWRRLF